MEALRTLFASYGLPQELVSDNAPQFTSVEFQTFLQKNSSVIYSTHLAAISSWLNSIFPFLSFMHPLAFFFVFLDVSSFTLCAFLLICIVFLIVPPLHTD